MKNYKQLITYHPGEILERVYLRPEGITLKKLSQDINMPFQHLQEVCQGTMDIGADLAYRLAFYLGTTPRFGLKKQQDYDLNYGASELKKIRKEIKYRGSKHYEKMTNSD